MAEEDACLAVDNASQQLEQVPAELQEVHKLKSHRRSLRTMIKLLRQFEGQEYDPAVAEWLRQVKDIANETQNLIGSMVVENNLRNERSKLGRLLSKGRAIKQQAEEIEEIGKRLQTISSFKDTDGSIKFSHNGRISFKIEEVVGFEEALETLVKQLTVEGGSQLEVLLIRGKAGSGKTTLAKMVFNDTRIRGHFDLHAWVNFPQELPLEELLWRILRYTRPSGNQTDCLMSKDDLEAELTESLKGKKYLIVIDSMHNCDIWDVLMSSFPDQPNGSRILLTSRSRPEDLHVGLSFSYEIKPLDESQSWQLLSRKVFGVENGPLELENLGKRMAADKCKGSPQAVVALAAILNHAEKTEELWSKFLRDYDELSHYHDLLGKQQLCLLYFGLFPVGIEIPVEQMIQMWMAEGFLKEEGIQTAEEIGEDYLQKLINQSFITRANERVKTSSHFSKLCISKGAAQEIFEIHMNSNSKPQKHINRMAIQSVSFMEVLKSFGECSHVHSLHTSSTSIPSVDFWGTLHHNFPNLKVLNLGSLDLDRVPKELGKLIHLRYLKLRAPSVTHLPSSIGNLQYLETLDMTGSHNLQRVPHRIWKIKLLRHLYLGGFTTLPETRGIDYYKALRSLQTLSGVDPDKVLKWLMVRAKFPNVTKLRICSSNPGVTFKFLNSLDHLYHLQSLWIEKPTNLPDPNAFPLSLNKLTLLETELPPDCIKTLENLPNLRELKLLEKSICGKEIECSAGGFSQLKILCMEGLILEKWTMGKGAMRCVKHLYIKGCDIKLEMIPDHLRPRTEWE